MSAGAVQVRAAAARTWLFDAALPLWADKGLDQHIGLFHEKLDAVTGAPVPSRRRVRVQARQAYVFIEAGRLGWPGPWRPLALAGIDALCGCARSGDGAAGHELDEAGALVDPRRDLYDQAFALFAMAHARGLDQKGADQRIGELLAYLETQRAETGGFLEGELKSAPRRQNPHMHLLEAGLALAAAGSAPGAALAREMTGLFDRFFYDEANGALGEYYAADFSRAPGDSGRLAEPGHHCEWIWLLDRWRRLSGESRADQAEKLWTHVRRAGLHGGVAIDEVWRDGGARSRTARLWPQTERLKAALIRYETGQGGADDVCAAYDGLALYFTGVREGLWRDRRGEDGVFVDEPAPASSFYHIILALSELFRVAALRP